MEEQDVAFSSSVWGVEAVVRIAESGSTWLTSASRLKAVSSYCFAFALHFNQNPFHYPPKVLLWKHMGEHLGALGQILG